MHFNQLTAKEERKTRFKRVKPLCMSQDLNRCCSNAAQQQSLVLIPGAAAAHGVQSVISLTQSLVYSTTNTLRIVEGTRKYTWCILMVFKVSHPTLYFGSFIY